MTHARLRQFAAPGLLVCAALTGLAQDPPPPPPPLNAFEMALPVPGSAGQRVFIQREGQAVGGGHGIAIERAATFTFMESGETGTVVKGAPYSAESETETIQTLMDGNRIVHKNTASIYRDTEGRTRREMSVGTLGPWSTDKETRIVSIYDPVAKVSYTLNEEEKIAAKVPGAGTVITRKMVRPPAGAKEQPRVVHEDHLVVKVESGASVGGEHPRITAFPSPSAAKNESLPERLIDGVKVTGTRTTHVIPAGQMGNERDIEIVFERWYSPELQVLVESRHKDPRTGETIYRLHRIRRGEQPRSLFEVPAGYNVVNEQLPNLPRKMIGSGMGGSMESGKSTKQPQE